MKTEQMVTVDSLNKTILVHIEEMRFLQIKEVRFHGQPEKGFPFWSCKTALKEASLQPLPPTNHWLLQARPFSSLCPADLVDVYVRCPRGKTQGMR